MDSTIRILKEYVLTEFLSGENPDELTEVTPLVTGGILDSLATLKLIAFLENQFGIQLKPHEATVDNLDTLKVIASLVESKRPK